MHRSTVTTANYLCVLHKETDRKRGGGRRQADDRGWTRAFIHFFHSLFLKGLLSACCASGRRPEREHKQAQRVTRLFITGNLFVYLRARHCAER